MFRKKQRENAPHAQIVPQNDLEKSMATLARAVVVHVGGLGDVARHLEQLVTLVLPRKAEAVLASHGPSHVAKALQTGRLALQEEIGEKMDLLIHYGGDPEEITAFYDEVTQRTLAPYLNGT